MLRVRHPLLLTSVPKPPVATLLPTWVSVSESSNRLCWEGRERREQLPGMPGRSCLAAFLLSPEGEWKGPNRATSLNPVFWNRTWKMMRMEPRPLQSPMGESAQGQSQVGTHPASQDPCLPLLSAGTWPVPTPLHSICPIRIPSPPSLMGSPVQLGHLTLCPVPAAYHCEAFYLLGILSLTRPHLPFFISLNAHPTL